MEGLSVEERDVLQGKKTLVTGAGTGIGKGIAVEFARRGADVAIHYSHSRTGAEEAVEEARKSGVRADAFGADFTNLDEVNALARQAAEFLGGLDILVNNAGITTNIPFEEVTPIQFDTLLQVNLRSPFFLTQSFLPHLLKSDYPSIINLTSIHALAGMPEHSVYAGTKGAIMAYTRELAIELAPRGIRVNAIAPGAVTVENHYRAMKSFDPKEMGKLIPAGFAGLPEDIAKLAVFLASRDSRYIVGQTIVADGGTTSWMPFGEEFKQRRDTQFGIGYVPGIGERRS